MLKNPVAKDLVVFSPSGEKSLVAKNLRVEKSWWRKVFVMKTPGGNKS